MKKHLIQIALSLALALVFFGHSIRLYEIPLITALDAHIYDLRLRMTMKGGVDERIVILDVDEKSLAELGRWPWNRETMARLVDKLFDDYGIAVLGFDVIFAEADTSSGWQSLAAIAGGVLKNDSAYQSALRDLKPALDYDQRFTDALRKRKTVLGYSFTNHDTAHRSGQLPKPAIPEQAFKGRNVPFISWNGYGANLPEFQNAAASAGQVNPVFDADGISRRVPILVEHQGKYYESMPLAVARLFLGNPRIIPGFPDESVITSKEENGLEWLELDTKPETIRIPVDEHVTSLIPYRGRQGSFRYLSAADALSGRLKIDQLKGKIVLFGTSAPGLMDLRATPVGASYPGVEIQANMIAGILDESIKAKPVYLIAAEIVLLTLCALLLAILLPILSPLRATLLTLLVLLAIFAVNFYLWSSGVAMPLASTLGVIFALFGPNMSWGYFFESRRKNQFADLFGQYVPPELVAKMAQDPERYSMEGRNEELTVLFSDVRGFTSISEGLDPKELTGLMNEYLGAMTEVIRRNQGTLDKYIGDAIMAFWGAPVADADHARNAVLTALQMQQELRRLDEPFRLRGWPILEIGVGINTGLMTVGDMGSSVRKSYTVMGDAVNLGARLEGLTKQYAVGIIISESTKLQVMQVMDMAFRELDRVRVKGKEQPVGIFEPLGATGQIDKTLLVELQLWHLALRLYRAQDWDQADLQLSALSAMNPGCRLYQLYMERVNHYRAQPPGTNWDGVTTFESK